MVRILYCKFKIATSEHLDWTKYNPVRLLSILVTPSKNYPFLSPEKIKKSNIRGFDSHATIC